MHSGLFLESKINIWSGQILQTRQQKYASKLNVWVMHNSLFPALIYEREEWKINRDVQMMWCVFCLMKWIKTNVNILWLVRTNYPWLFNNSLSKIFLYLHPELEKNNNCKIFDWTPWSQLQMHPPNVMLIFPKVIRYSKSRELQKF